MSRFDRILISGGSGMLARALVDSLATRGHRAKAIGRAEWDIVKADSSKAIFEQNEPTLLFNCAAHTKVDLCEDQENEANAINGRAVGTLAELSKRYGTILVHFSTDFVFDGRGARPYLPGDPVAPLSVYGKSKLLGETMLQEIAPPGWLIARTSWLYGASGASFPKAILNAARAGKPLNVVSDQIGSPTWVNDLADATILAVERSVGGVHHITNSGQTSWYEFAREILNEFGLTDVPVNAITTEHWRAMRPNQARRPAYSVLQDPAIDPLPPWRDALRRFAKSVGTEPF